jgi:hypothetical protein
MACRLARTLRRIQRGKAPPPYKPGAPLQVSEDKTKGLKTRPIDESKKNRSLHITTGLIPYHFHRSENLPVALKFLSTNSV